MGEVAALSAAFESETNKALASLPAIASCPPSAHDAHLNHHRACQRITELISYYSSKLPPYVCISRILSIGDRLSRQGEHRLAADVCYSHVEQLNMHLQDNVPRMDEAARISCHVQACYGIAACKAALAIAADSSVKHPDTLQTLVSCLKQLKQALSMVLPVEQLYWLTLNGTVHIYNFSKHLLTAGFASHVLPFLLFCVKALEQHVTFSTAKYLPWRTQLYTVLCYAYSDAKAHGLARQVVQDGLAHIDSLIKLQKLDPVPAPPEIQTAYKTAKAMLCGLKFKLEVQSAPTQPPPTPPPADKKGAAAAAAQADSGLAALQPLLTEISISPKFKLTVMLEALQIPGRRVVRHEPVHGLIKDVFELVKADAGVLMGKLSEALVAWKASQQPADGSGAAPDAPVTPEKEQQSVLGSPHVSPRSSRLPSHPSNFNPPESEEFSLLLHRALMCTAFNFEQWEMFQQLVKLAHDRISVRAVGEADEAQLAVFSAVTRLLEATEQLEKSPGAESVRQTSHTLAAISDVARMVVPDMLTDAAINLYNTAKPLLSAVNSAKDKESDLVMCVLRTLHACWEAVDVDDGTLRVKHALKLALLLEEHAVQDQDNNLLYEAREVLTACQSVVTRFRCQLNAALSGRPDEGVRWITASRNQPNEATAALVADMADTDGELACFHTDVVAALFRVEMAIGVAEQHAQALGKQTKLADSVRRREAQSNIFGVRTMKEKRLDEIRIAAAASTPSNPQQKERELLQACGKNTYEKAIALMQMAPYQSDQHRQIAMLTESADLLVKAQEREDTQFLAAQPDHKKTSVPMQPKILQRTPTSVTLTNFPFNLKGGKRVARYAVYAKAFGAGVALILNKTASEYPGTGTQVAPGSRITVDGLLSNDTYVFGIAAYDEAGNLISELGTSSPEILAGLPLPLYHCWSHLLQTACKLKLWALAKRASGVLFPHFIVTTPDRPLWEANPMSAQHLAEQHVELASRTLLRAFVKGVYAYTGAMLNNELASLQAGAAGKGSQGGGRAPPLAELRAPYLDEQVARLKSVRRVVLAVHVCVLLNDEMLTQEGTVRVYQLLGPLLAVKDKTPLLHSALAAIYVALQSVTNLIQDSQYGQELQRSAAARVACGATFFAVSMADKCKEHDVMSNLAALQLELLKAYDPRYTITGRPPTEAVMPDILAIQDALLSHPNAQTWAAANPEGPLALRMKDEADLVAKVLPLIGGPTPMDAWTTWLNKEDSAQHPRWVELVARTLEACVRSGHLDTVIEIGETVRWFVKSALVRPAIDFPGPKWRLDEAAAALTDVTLTPEEEPPKPEVEGLSDDDKAAAEAAWSAARDAALLKARQRTAAVILLQRRLPVLLTRKRVVDECRNKARSWAPWRSRLAAVIGVVEGRAGRAEAAERARAQILDLSEGAPGEGHAAGRPESGAKTTKPGSASKAGKAGKKEDAPAARPVDGAPLGDASTALRALQQMARAAQLAARCEAWHELLNATRHTWNIARALLNTDVSLMNPLAPVVWEQGAMPEPPQAPPSLLQPGAGGGKDAKGKPAAGKKDDPKGKAKPPSAKGGKKGAGDAAPVERVWPPIWLPKGSILNTGRVLRSAAEAVLDLLTSLKSGSQFWTGVLPLPSTSEFDPEKVAHGAAADQRTEQPATEYASSLFSFGSDLQADLWFQSSCVNMDWINKFLVTVLNIELRMQRWHTVIALGHSWLKLCEGVYSESVLPILMAAATQASVDVAPFQSAMEVVVRDKNVALDALDKVRKLIRDKLGDVTVLNQPVGTKVKKKKRAQAPGGRPGTGSSSVHSLHSGGTAGDTASMVTAVTNASTMKTNTSQPDFIRLPAEYEKVIEVLKQRGEKGAMILATSELGDVHAHFGNWHGAITAWSDALDTLIGPYQVIKNWRKVLDPMTDRAILQQFGVHGCLVAGGILLGKLARYAYFSNQGLRLEAARMAAVLLRSLFCIDCVHPQRPVGFATYVPREIWQGVDVFANSYRCNMTDLLSGLETLVACLIDAGQPLEALPLCALWEHVSYLTTRNLAATVLCRIQRVHACVQLGLLKEAAELLSSLIQGQKLPDATLDSDLVVKDSEGKALQVTLVRPFNPAAYPGDATNKDIISLIASGPFHPALLQLYGDWAVARLALARSAFLQALGQVPNLWVSTNPAEGQSASGSGQLPPAIEASLMDQAAALVARAKCMAEGKPWEPEAGARPSTPPGGKSAAKAAPPAKKDDKKGKDDPKKGGGDAEAGGASVGPLTAAQRSEVKVRALLCESRIEANRMRPQAGLSAALEALRFMGGKGEAMEGLNVPLGDNDDTERYSLGPGLWLEARLQAVLCSIQLRNTKSSHALLDVSLEEAAEVSDGRVAAVLLHMRANLQHLTGNTAKALNTYTDVITRYQALSLCDMRLVSAMTDAAILRDQIGLRSDSHKLFNSALQTARQWVSAIGLNEAREYKELVNLYAAGLPLFSQLLVHTARCHMRQRQLQGGIALLEEALQMQHNTRTTPMQRAWTELVLGRSLRLGIMMAEMSDTAGQTQRGAPSTAVSITATPEQIQRIQTLLCSAYKLAALDGGHNRDVMRGALLEMAAMYVQGASAAQAVACLRHAHSVACKRDALLMSSHMFAPVAVAQVPPWAKEVVQGFEESFSSGKGGGKPAGSASLSDADTGRLVMCHFVSLVRDLPSLPSTESARAQTCLALLHQALKSACPKYASDACQAEIALPPAPPADAAASAAVLQPGTVLVQWSVQDCCQMGSSNQCSSSLSGPVSSDAELMGLQPVRLGTSMLYVVVRYTGEALVGTRMFEVGAVRAVQQQVRTLRHRLESPKGANDLFGMTAPTSRELRSLRKTSEHFLSGRRLSEDGGLHADSDGEADILDQPPIPAAPTPAPAGKAAPAKGKAAEKEVAPPQPTGPSPTDLTFLTRLEAMLNVDNGVELVDGGFAEFLAQVLGAAAAQ